MRNVRKPAASGKDRERSLRQSSKRPGCDQALRRIEPAASFTTFYQHAYAPDNPERLKDETRARRIAKPDRSRARHAATVRLMRCAGIHERVGKNGRYMPAFPQAPPRSLAPGSRQAA